MGGGGEFPPCPPPPSGAATADSVLDSIKISGVDRSSKVVGMIISDFKKNTENILRANARERSDRAGVGPLPTVGIFFNFGGQNHVIWCMQ